MNALIIAAIASGCTLTEFKFQPTITVEQLRPIAQMLLQEKNLCIAEITGCVRDRAHARNLPVSLATSEDVIACQKEWAEKE